MQSIYNNLHIFLALISFITALVLIKYVKIFFFRIGFLDKPNERSNHSLPTALGGGVIIVPIILFLAYIFDNNFNNILLIISIFLFSISLLDDFKNVGAAYRLLLHLICMALYTLAYIKPELSDFFLFFNTNKIATYFLLLIILVSLTWFINAFNFMDGIDGISSLQIIHIILSIIIIKLFLGQKLDYIYFIILGTITAFLIFNWSPAKIFLGDSGSIPLGFLCLHLLIELIFLGYWVAAILIPLYYILDSGVTLFMRIKRREKFWVSHSKHFYQIAVKNGKSHSLVCFNLLFFSVVLFFLSFLSVLYKNNFFILIFGLGLGALFLFFLRKPNKFNETE